MTGTGRPRNPNLDGRIIDTATTVLAIRRLPGFTMEEVAASAGVGKGTIYRRWKTQRHLLIDVVEQLGVRDFDYGPEPGTAREDLIRLLVAASTGPLALAEAAILPAVGLDEGLQVAYFAGPAHRLTVAAGAAAERGLLRGESWSLEPIRAAAAWLTHRTMVAGVPPVAPLIANVVDNVVLPALDLYPARSLTS